jgi:hypothetical protein
MSTYNDFTNRLAQAIVEKKKRQDDFEAQVRAVFIEIASQLQVNTDPASHFIETTEVVKDLFSTAESPTGVDAEKVVQYQIKFYVINEIASFSEEVAFSFKNGIWHARLGGSSWTLTGAGGGHYGEVAARIIQALDTWVKARESEAGIS